jgi:predicted protein tyrosine phosphatase
VTDGRLRVHILSRGEAETFSSEEPYAIIAATDPDLADAAYDPSPFCRKVLRLKFSDITYQCCSKHRLFGDEHVEPIVEFAQWFRESGIEQLVVHCEGGISRSAAIGLSIAKFLDADESTILQPQKRHRPNPFIYWRLTRALLPGRELELVEELFEWTARNADAMITVPFKNCSEEG